MAKIYYSTTGNDSAPGDGSLANPYATPGKCLTESSNGDLIVGRAGTYTVNSLDTGGDWGGTTFVNYPGEEVIWQQDGANGVVTPTSTPMIGIHWDGINFGHGTASPQETFRLGVDVWDCSIRNARQYIHASYAPAADRYFIHLYQNSRNLVVDNFQMEAVEDFQFVRQQATKVSDSIELTRTNVRGIDGFLGVSLPEVAGVCKFSGHLEGDYTGDMFRIGKADRPAVLDFDLDVINNNNGVSSTAVNIGEDNTGPTIYITGKRLYGNGSSAGVLLERGVSGHIELIHGVGRLASGGAGAVLLRSDNADSNELAVKNLTIDRLIADAEFGNEANHAVLLGRFTKNIKILDAYVKSSGYGLIDKGTNNQVFGVINGGFRAGLHHKGAMGGSFSGQVSQSNGGPAYRVERDETYTDPGDYRSCEANRVTRVFFDVNDGALLDWDANADDGGSIVDHNEYRVADGATWGTLAGDTVASFTAVKDKWAADYDVTTNDAGSRERESDSDLAIKSVVDDTSVTPSASAFAGVGNLSASDDFYSEGGGSLVVFLSGDLRGLARPVVDYDGASRTVTVSPAFPSAPADGDRFKLIGRA
jgi:hypothetical protein